MYCGAHQRLLEAKTLLPAALTPTSRVYIFRDIHFILTAQRVPEPARSLASLAR